MWLTVPIGLLFVCTLTYLYYPTSVSWDVGFLTLKSSVHPNLNEIGPWMLELKRVKISGVQCPNMSTPNTNREKG